MTQKELEKAVEARWAADGKTSVGAVFSVIAEFVLAGEEISIKNFGKFLLKKLEAGTARNVRTGEEIQVPERTKVAFKPSKKTKGV